MNLINLKKSTLELSISMHELLTMSQAINEAYNGLHIPEREAIIGMERADARKLLRKFRAAYEDMEKLGKCKEQDTTHMLFEIRELLAIEKSFHEVNKQLDINDFSTRMGAQIEEADSYLKQLKSIIEKVSEGA